MIAWLVDDRPGWESLLVAAGAGAALGRMLTAGVSRLVDPQPHRDQTLHRAVEIVTVVAAVALWWWEGVRGGLIEATSHAGTPATAVRYGAHIVLFGFLAAAAWVDLRHRVIPDVITVPGVLLGLGWSALWPTALLPIHREQPREFATPLSVPDVLTWTGGLRTDPPPEWLGGFPAWAGLGIAMTIFAVWWLVGTQPTPESTRRAAARDPRNLVGAIGTALVAITWASGGDHWAGLLSSLVGLAVAAGVIWLVRAGASRAVGREAMGMGDVTLMAMAGAWLGWQPCVLACILAVFIGLGHAAVQAVSHREEELPFGPSLCLALVGVVVWWRAIWGRAGHLFSSHLDLLLTVAVAVIGLTPVALWSWRKIRPRAVD